MVFSSESSLNWDMPVPLLVALAPTPVALVHKPPTLAHGSLPSPLGSHTSFTSSFTLTKQD